MKKNVEVFTVKRQWLSTYDFNCVSYHVMPDAVPFRHDQFFSAEEMRVKEVQLPIISFYNREKSDGGVIERLCAFDHDLMMLIGCMQDQKDREISYAATEARQNVERKLQPSLDRLSKYENMSFVQKIKFLFGMKIK